jgi:hypothetical protein
MLYVIRAGPARRHPRAEPSPAARTVDRDRRFVRANGIVQVAAASALALGVLPRVAAVVLVGSPVPETFAGHRFWNEPTRSQELTAVAVSKEPRSDRRPPPRHRGAAGRSRSRLTLMLWGTDWT